MKLRHLPLAVIATAVNVGIYVTCVTGVLIYVGYRYYATNKK